jgi:hypothetical protein
MFKFRARLDIGNSPAYIKGGSKQRFELSTVLRIAPKAALKAVAGAYSFITFVENVV